MILLDNLMFSRQVLNSDSNYVLLRNLVTGLDLLGRLDDKIFVVLWPINFFKYYDDGFFEKYKANVVRVPIKMPRNKQQNAINFDSLYFRRLFEKIPVDVVINNLVEVGGNLKFLQDSYEDMALPKVLNFNHYVIHKSLPYSIKFQENVLLAQVIGNLLADMSIINSDHCGDMLRDNYREYLSPDKVALIENKTYKISLGVDFDKLRGFKREREKDDKIIFIYNHRLQAYKAFHKTFAMFAGLWGEGLTNFEVWVTGANREGEGKVSQYPFVKFFECPTYESYLNVIKDGDVNVTNSLHETFCISAVESMALGQMLVAPDGVTFREITNADASGYPYLFKKDKDQTEIVRQILLKEVDPQSVGATLSAYVLGAYDKTVYAEQIANLLDKVTQTTFRSSVGAIEYFEKMISSKPSWLFDELKDELMTKVNGVNIFGVGRQSFTIKKIKNIANELGYVDKLVDKKIYVVKR
jgi:glycosyltransferase involved in cell wall biosynthesis